VKLDGHPIPNTSWTYLVLDPGPARPCSSAPVPGEPETTTFKAGEVELPWYDFKPVPALVATVEYPQAMTNTFALQTLCLHWSSKSPVATKGAYLSARFPPVHGIAVDQYGTILAQSDGGGDLATAKVTRVLNLAGATTADFNVQSTPQPVPGGQSWTWASQDLPQAVQLAAINSSDLQQENNNAFYAGILFGIVGGALVALIVELIRPLSRRDSS
jgi:hypothetical protein